MKIYYEITHFLIIAVTIVHRSVAIIRGAQKVVDTPADRRQVALLVSLDRRHGAGRAGGEEEEEQEL